ncbi:hypothetical protein HZH68_013831 [Vespula germanica]|uniref:Uncharacterized protein n=1 Tax=Vespula germanica TaxID=30212 RepID=A0A834JBE1_VESGE|nr:hypothetical protein HZH68_013831 [Vespula germanica]
MRLGVESNKWLTTYHGHEKKGSKDVDTCRDLRSRNYGYAVSVTIQAERSHAPIISLARSSISSLGYTIGVNSCGRLQLGTGFRAARIIHDWVVPDEFERQDNGGGVGGGGGGVDGGVGGGSDGGGGGGGLDRRFMRSKERQGGRQSEIGTWRSRHEEMRREEKRNGEERREGDAEVISNVEVEDERIKEKEKRVCKG